MDGGRGETGAEVTRLEVEVEVEGTRCVVVL